MPCWVALRQLGIYRESPDHTQAKRGMDEKEGGCEELKKRGGGER